MMDFNYSKQKFNFTDAYCQVLNKDASIIEPLSKNYVGLDRSKIKAVNLIVDGKIFYTLQIKGNRLIYRKRSIIRTSPDGDEFTTRNPKRAIILETEGKIVFIWDSGEIKEFKSYGDIVQYQAPKYRDDEK